jgi:CPA2 family monovalent cation:H+ antiporter-2
MQIHDMPLVATVAFGLTMAFICGLIASRFKLSPLVGYLFAGILIGPHTPGYVANQDIANQLSEIGIVLLMFGVGLHFSIKDLMDVRKIAITGALAQMAVSIGFGYVATVIWDWPLSVGVLFGLACSVASTVVMTRAMEDNHLMESITGKISVGWLIVQDLVMILALVLIPPIAAATTGDGNESMNIQSLMTDVAIAIAKISVFVVFMIVVGKTVFPRLLQIVAATHSRELFTLAVIAVAVGVAFAAGNIFGVSLALGAFFSGMMVRETELSHEVAERALPFQDAFAVLFFVSVGMLFNPQILFDKPLIVFFCVLMIVVGKSIPAFLIVLMHRYPLKTAMHVSSGMAQIGEFSFILATFGVAYNMMTPEVRDAILAAAIISIILNPFTFVFSDMVLGLEKKYPKLFSYLSRYRDDELAHLTKEEVQTLRKTVILVGAGRVGTYICNHSSAMGFDLVVIDSNRERVEDLRAQGFHAIAGDASSPETLQEAVITNAVAMIVVIPDVFEAVNIVAAARKANPKIKLMVQDRYDPESSREIDALVDLKVSASDEISQRMLGYIQKL